MFEVIFIVFTGIYFFLLVYVTSGLSEVFSRNKNFKPRVSVIVAARNEKDNIIYCLTALEKQSYDKNNYEVIIADDFSEDGTAELIDNFIKGRAGFFKVIPPENEPRGKVSALKSATDISSGEILLFTDADCIPPPGWIEGMVSYYDNKTGMVNSFSISDGTGIKAGIQAIDLMFLVSVAAGMANNNHPASCIGNNMSVTKDVYKLTGGYGKIAQSVTEDYSLLNAAASLKKFRIRFPADESLIVRTKPLKNLREIFHQKKRWAVGGLSNPNKSIYLMFAAFITNLLCLLCLFFYSPAVLLIFLFKLFSDLFFLLPVFKKLNALKYLKYFIFFEVYYLLYTTIIPIVLLFSKKIYWKSRTY